MFGLAFGLVATFGMSTSGPVHGGEGADRIDYHIALNTLFDGGATGAHVCFNMGCGLHPFAGFVTGINDKAESWMGGMWIALADASSCEGINCFTAGMPYMIGYCSEADVPAQSLQFSGYTETTIDPRLQYLLFKYDWEYYDNRANDDISSHIELSAVQALVWAWHSDPNAGSTVFSGADDPYDDPFEWDGLIPVAPSSDGLMPGVGFWTNDNDDIDRLATTQAVYDLAVEAQNKAGDWSLSHSDDGEGIYLLNENGLPIYGETVVFDDHGAEAVTDSSGYVEWPDDSMYATTLKPGRSFETPGAPDDEGNDSQNFLVTLGEPISILNNFTTTPSTTTTTAPPTTTTVPATATTVPATTTTVPATTTTTVASPDASTSSTTTAAPTPTTNTGVQTSTTSSTAVTATSTTGTSEPPTSPVELPATGITPSKWPGVPLIAIGCALLLLTRLPKKKLRHDDD